jgi:hypothetical protein
VLDYNKRRKSKTEMIISTDAEKTFDKNSTFFYGKHLPGIEVMFLTMIKVTCGILILTIYLMQRQKLSSKLRSRKRISILAISISTI